MPAYKRKVKRGEMWRYMGSFNGVKYSSKSIYTTKKNALDAEREFLRQKQEEAQKPRKEIMLKDLLLVRLDNIKANKSKKYYDENQRYLKMLIDRVGNVPVDQIAKKQINDLITDFSARLKQTGKTQHKANAMLRILKATFSYGLDLFDLDLKNPCHGLKFAPIDRKLKHIPTDAEINAVKAISDPIECLLIDFAIQSGGRINEILRFKRDDMQNGIIVLYTRKSRNSDLVGRKLPIPECIKTLEWKGRLFKRWTDYPKFLEHKVKELKQQPWAFHNLRHRFASLEVKKGTHIYIISQLLGHSSIKTTEIYLQQLF